ncbi:MAG TPA: hypothetical protein VG370_30410 [Chloroflexota bacterium]|nr:hypothetical protein [Chloroflexota bacterium]
MIPRCGFGRGNSTVGAVRHPGPYRDYFLRRTVAGKHKMDSLVAIGRKILATVSPS